MKKLALALSILVLMCGCGGNGPSKLIVVTLNPLIPPNIDQGQSIQFNASLASNTPGNTSGGVTWSLTGPGCSGVRCGTLTNITSTSATYVAPASVAVTLAVMVTATSVAQPTQSAISPPFYVMPPPSIVTTNLSVASPNYIYSFPLQGTGGVQPLNWSLVSGALPVGLSMNSAGVIYGTPTTGGTSTFTVKVTDSSAAPGGRSQRNKRLASPSSVSSPSPPPRCRTALWALPTAPPSPHTGGLVPYDLDHLHGSLPSGLVLQAKHRGDFRYAYSAGFLLFSLWRHSTPAPFSSIT